MMGQVEPQEQLFYRIRLEDDSQDIADTVSVGGCGRGMFRAVVVQPCADDWVVGRGIWHDRAVAGNGFPDADVRACRYSRPSRRSWG